MSNESNNLRASGGQGDYVDENQRLRARVRELEAELALWRKRAGEEVRAAHDAAAESLALREKIERAVAALTHQYASVDRQMGQRESALEVLRG